MQILYRYSMELKNLFSAIPFPRKLALSLKHGLLQKLYRLTVRESHISLRNVRTAAKGILSTQTSKGRIDFTTSIPIH